MVRGKIRGHRYSQINADRSSQERDSRACPFNFDFGWGGSATVFIWIFTLIFRTDCLFDVTSCRLLTCLLLANAESHASEMMPFTIDSQNRLVRLSSSKGAFSCINCLNSCFCSSSCLTCSATARDRNALSRTILVTAFAFVFFVDNHLNISARHNNKANEWNCWIIGRRTLVTGAPQPYTRVCVWYESNGEVTTSPDTNALNYYFSWTHTLCKKSSVGMIFKISCVFQHISPRPILLNYREHQRVCKSSATTPTLCPMVHKIVTHTHCIIIFVVASL